MNNLNFIKMERAVKFYDWYKSLGGDVSKIDVERINTILNAPQKTNSNLKIQKSSWNS